MVYCSINSRKRVYHTEDCWYTARTKEENRITFRNPSLAENAGYGPCSCCCEIGRQYRKERRAIRSFCAENGYRHFLRHGEMYVISDADTAWRIVPKGDSPAFMILYHESLGGVPYDRESTDYPERQFHQQNTFKPDICGYLGYIRCHDEYRKEMLERRRAEREKFRDEVMQIYDVRRIIARQNRKRGKVRSMRGAGQDRHVKNRQLKMLAQAASSYRTAKAAYL